MEHISGILTPPDRQTLCMLLDLACIGDVIGLQEHARILEANEPQLKMFGKQLRQLADDFLVDDMQTFLQAFLETEQ